MPPRARSRASYTRCSEHGTRAGWRCTTCERTLCPNCTAQRRMPDLGTALAVCVHCGGMAAPLTRPKRVRDYLSGLPYFIQSFTTMDGVTTLTAFGIVVYILTALGGGVFAWAISVAYMFTIIQAAAQGAERLPDPTDFTGLMSLLFPVVRLIFATSYVWLPAVLYITYVVTWGALYWDGPARIIGDPVLIGLVIAGLVYFPVAVVVAAVSDSVLAVLDPRIGVSIIGRLPLQYVGAVLLSCFFLGVGMVYNLFTLIVVAIIPVPIVPGLITTIIGGVFWMTPGWILGRFIYQNHEHFGLMLQGADTELEWPEAVPLAPAAPDGSRSNPPATVAAPAASARQDWAQGGQDWQQGGMVAAPRAVEAIEIEGWSDRPDPTLAPDSASDAGRSGSRMYAPSNFADDLELDADPAPPLAASTYAASQALPGAAPGYLAGQASPPSPDFDPAFNDGSRSADLPPLSSYAGPENAGSSSGMFLGGPPPSGSRPTGVGPRIVEGIPLAAAALTDPDPRSKRGAQPPARGFAPSALGPQNPGAAPGRQGPAAGPGPQSPGQAPAQQSPGAAPARQSPGQAPAQQSPGAAPGRQGPAAGPGPQSPGQAPARQSPAAAPARQSPAAAAPGASGALSPAWAAASGGPNRPADGTGAVEGHALVAKLQAVLQQDAGVAALQAYQQCRHAGVEVLMEPRLELRLAAMLERAQEFEAAVAACRRAADQDLSGPFAPRAVYMAAQLYHRRLKDSRRAAALYRYLVETFPGDQLAAHADDALRRLEN